MPALRFSAYALELDVAGYRAALDKRMETVMRTAARLFVRAALAEVPVRTGFAAGSLGNLAVAGGDQPPNPAPTVRHKEFYYPRKGSRILKTPANARRFATPAGDVFHVESGRFYHFGYSISVIYYPVNDPRWRSFEAGSEAVRAYLNGRVLAEVPRLSKFLRRTRVKV